MNDLKVCWFKSHPNFFISFTNSGLGYCLTCVHMTSYHAVFAVFIPRVEAT